MSYDTEMQIINHHKFDMLILVFFNGQNYHNKICCNVFVNKSKGTLILNTVYHIKVILCKLQCKWKNVGKQKL
jgi:hypothetical protein